MCSWLAQGLYGRRTAQAESISGNFRDRSTCDHVVTDPWVDVCSSNPFTMSRLSRANLKARDSIFTSGPSIYRTDAMTLCPPDLEECVAAIEDCCEEVLIISPPRTLLAALTQILRYVRHRNS